MKILWPHNFSPDITNAGNFMHSFAKALEKSADIKIDLFYLGNLRKPKEMIAARKELQRVSKDYDIVHAQFGSACGFVTSSVKKPKVLSLRGSDWHRYKGNNKFALVHGFLAYAMSRYSLGKFDRVITMSNRMTQEVQRVSPRIKAVTIADPIDNNLFSPRDKLLTRKEVFQSNDSSPWILFTTLSKENPVKQVALAEEAIQLAQQAMPDIKIKIANGLAHKDMPKFVASCDMALCTSTHEGWPNSLKEALACGLPFVSTDVSDLKEIAQRQASCFVCSSDPTELGSAICEVLSNKDIQHKALRKEVAPMSMSSSCQRLFNLYKELVA